MIFAEMVYMRVKIGSSVRSPLEFEGDVSGNHELCMALSNFIPRRARKLYATCRFIATGKFSVHSKLENTSPASAIPENVQISDLGIDANLDHK